MSLGWQSAAVSVGFVPSAAGQLHVLCGNGSSLLLNATSGGAHLAGVRLHGPTTCRCQAGRCCTGCPAAVLVSVPRLAPSQGQGWQERPGLGTTARSTSARLGARCLSTASLLACAACCEPNKAVLWGTGRPPQAQVVAGAPDSARLLRPVALPLALSSAQPTLLYFTLQVRATGLHHALLCIPRVAWRCCKGASTRCACQLYSLSAHSGTALSASPVARVLTDAYQDGLRKVAACAEVPGRSQAALGMHAGPRHSPAAALLEIRAHGHGVRAACRMQQGTQCSARQPARSALRCSLRWQPQRCARSPRSCGSWWSAQWSCQGWSRCRRYPRCPQRACRAQQGRPPPQAQGGLCQCSSASPMGRV